MRPQLPHQREFHSLCDGDTHLTHLTHQPTPAPAARRNAGTGPEAGLRDSVLVYSTFPLSLLPSPLHPLTSTVTTATVMEVPSFIRCVRTKPGGRRWTLQILQASQQARIFRDSPLLCTSSLPLLPSVLGLLILCPLSTNTPWKGCNQRRSHGSAQPDAGLRGHAAAIGQTVIQRYSKSARISEKSADPTSYDIITQTWVEGGVRREGGGRKEEGERKEGGGRMEEGGREEEGRRKKGGGRRKV